MTRVLARAVPCAAVAAAYWPVLSSQSQLFGRFPRGSSDDPSDRRIALTFDDGPNAPYTTRLADLLDERRIRGTFFQVGRAVRRDPETSRRLLAAGHVVGNHSHSHRFRRCLREPLIADEVARAQDVFGEHLGLRPRLYRPPWLARVPATFRVLAAHDLHAVSGTFCHPLEVARIASGTVAARAVARARPGRILIFHDGYNGSGADRSRSVDAVARTADLLSDAGWRFVTVAELLGVDAYG